jgi:hypothetical protein
MTTKKITVTLKIKVSAKGIPKELMPALAKTMFPLFTEEGFTTSVKGDTITATITEEVTEAQEARLAAKLTVAE